MFLENNIRIYHIWEDDWDFKKDIVKSMISSKINIIKNKIHARKCEIKYVDNNESKNFLNDNQSIEIGIIEFEPDEKFSQLDNIIKNINNKSNEFVYDINDFPPLS